jgi:hypothetical protein
VATRGAGRGAGRGAIAARSAGRGVTALRGAGAVTTTGGMGTVDLSVGAGSAGVCGLGAGTGAGGALSGWVAAGVSGDPAGLTGRSCVQARAAKSEPTASRIAGEQMNRIDMAHSNDAARGARAKCEMIKAACRRTRCRRARRRDQA